MKKIEKGTRERKNAPVKKLGQKKLKLLAQYIIIDISLAINIARHSKLVTLTPPPHTWPYFTHPHSCTILHYEIF